MGGGQSKHSKLDTEIFMSYVKVYNDLFIDRTHPDKPNQDAVDNFEKWVSLRSKETQYNFIVKDVAPMKTHIAAMTTLRDVKHQSKPGGFFLPTPTISTSSSSSSIGVQELLPIPPTVIRPGLGACNRCDRCL